MSKQTLSVRDFSIIYNIINNEIIRMEEPPWYPILNDKLSQKEDKGKHMERIKSDPHYQDLLRIREQLGTLNIEIETPRVKVGEIL